VKSDRTWRDHGQERQNGDAHGIPVHDEQHDASKRTGHDWRRHPDKGNGKVDNPWDLNGNVAQQAIGHHPRLQVVIVEHSLGNGGNEEGNYYAKISRLEPKVGIKVCVDGLLG